jgi:outer membrane protein assembly factor BamB
MPQSRSALKALAAGLGLLLAAGAAVVAYRPSWHSTRPAEPVPARPAVVWMFEPPERGAILSSPRVTETRVFVATIHDAGFATCGAVYALDRATGKVVWRFDDGGTMLHTYSSPWLADGRLYIGEGMHANFACKLYCLDAATGRKLWHFEAAGHIESSPCVAGGAVFFGAGDDGLYCLDAVTGARRWKLEGPFHFDSNPAVSGGRVYAGSGVSRRHKEPQVFCLDAGGGQVLWRQATELPAWGSPVVDGGQVFVGLGTGRLTRRAEPPEVPAGALLCLDADSGAVRWRYAAPDALFVTPAVGPGHVYFGCRDHGCYCIERRAGTLVWRADLSSPVMTRPALVGRRLYVVASGGRVACLEADDGRAIWTFDVGAHTQTKPQLYSSPAVFPESPDAPDRRLYFGSELKNPVSSAAVLFCLGDP